MLNPTTHHSPFTLHPPTTPPLTIRTPPIHHHTHSLFALLPPITTHHSHCTTLPQLTIHTLPTKHHSTSPTHPTTTHYSRYTHPPLTTHHSHSTHLSHSPVHIYVVAHHTPHFQSPSFHPCTLSPFAPHSTPIARLTFRLPSSPLVRLSSAHSCALALVGAARAAHFTRLRRDRSQPYAQGKAPADPLVAAAQTSCDWLHLRVGM